MPKSLHTPGYRLFCRLLREARTEAEISQTELARRLGVGQDFVSKCERGVRRLDAVELREWCFALGVPFAAFVSELDRALPKLKQRG